MGAGKTSRWGGFDLGGTTARFGVFDRSVGTPDTPIRVVTAPIEGLDFREIVGALETAADVRLRELDGVGIAAAGTFDTPGAVHHRRYRDGQLDLVGTARTHCCKRLWLGNDFEGQAWAARLCLDGDVSGASIEWITDTTIDRDSKAPLAVVGPGTGLGHAGLRYVDKRWIALTAESGHGAIPVRFPEEQRPFLNFVEQHAHELETGMCVEEIGSGRGLRLIHRYLTGEVIDPVALVSGNHLRPTHLSLFALYLGMQCCNYVLGLNAKGLILSGGVLQRTPQIVTGEGKANFFRGLRSSSWHNKSWLNELPVGLMRVEDAGVLGAAYAASKFGERIL